MKSRGMRYTIGGRGPWWVYDLRVMRRMFIYDTLAEAQEQADRLNKEQT